MIASPTHQRHASIALAGQGVVLATKAKLCFARVGGEQGGRVVHGGSKHAELILEDNARRKKRPLQFDLLLRRESKS